MFAYINTEGASFKVNSSNLEFLEFESESCDNLINFADVHTIKISSEYSHWPVMVSLYNVSMSCTEGVLTEDCVEVMSTKDSVSCL